MIRVLLLALVGVSLAIAPDDDAWESEVLTQLSMRMPQVERIRDGGFRSEDRDIIRVLANYGAFKASRKRDDDAAKGEARANRAFYFSMLKHKTSIDYLASGGRPRPQDSTVIAVMAIFLSANMLMLKNSEIGP